MQQFNFPTTLLFGEGALIALAERLQSQIKHALLVTDKTLVKAGLADRVAQSMIGQGKVKVTVFDEVHPNPLEADVDAGVAAYEQAGCDSLLALGGGSPMDVAKVIRFRLSHGGPLAQYDDALGGDKLIQGDLPPLFAIPTTAGTGSEVGRSGVIVLRDSGKKTIFFHPRLMPDMAILEPSLTVGLPPAITAATGVDALTHCLEALLAPTFHPMADGIALEGMRLILRHLPTAFAHGEDLRARGCMQMAAAMGATAFQKGLGMVHSLAHPLSARYNTHHGLANALLLPHALAFLEKQALGEDAWVKWERVHDLFREAGLAKDALSQSVRAFLDKLQIPFGLERHGVPKADLQGLSQDAIEDGCHATNVIPVRREDMLAVYQAAW